MVVGCPLPTLGEFVWQLRPETEVMDLMLHGVFDIFWGVEVATEVMCVHLTPGKAVAGSDVKVSNHLVYSDNALNTAAFMAL